MSPCSRHPDHSAPLACNIMCNAQHRAAVHIHSNACALRMLLKSRELSHASNAHCPHQNKKAEGCNAQASVYSRAQEAAE